MKKSELKKRLVEALTPDEAAKVEPKYKETYAAMIKGKGPLKLKKYDNPDKVVRGRVVNTIKNESLKIAEKLGKKAKVGDYIEDFTDSNAPQFKGKSDKKKKQMAVAAFLNKEEQKLDEIDTMMEEDELTKSEKNKLKKVSSQLKKSVKAHDKQSKTIDKIVSETGQEIAKKNMDDYKRLNELVKAALMGPINENRYDINDPNSPMGKLNDEYESSGLKGIVDKYGLDVVLMMLSSGEYGDRLNETSTDKYDDNPALKGKQSDLPDGLQKAIIKKSGGKVDEYASLARYDKDGNKTVTTIDDIDILPRHKRLQNEMAFNDFIAMLKALGYDIPEGILSMEENIDESFKSLSKKIDKQKGKSKKDADNIAGYIANIKRKGGGKGPTAKQKKRMAETILKELRGGNVKLSPQEQEIFDDITSSLNEGMFDDVLEKVKRYARKGLMTVALLSALAAPNLGFSQVQQQQLKDVAQTEMSTKEISRMNKISIVTTALSKYKRGKDLDKLDDYLKQDLDGVKGGIQNADQLINIFDFHQDALQAYVPLAF
jgi:hypothetical protein